MTNPWLKKNPFMSMWLSGANRMAGMMRGQAKRQINTALTQASKEMLGAATHRAKPKKRRR
jgi:hypothetical protein